MHKTKFNLLKILQSSSIRTEIGNVAHTLHPLKNTHTFVSSQIIIPNILRRQDVVSIMSAVVMRVVHIIT